ncbi:MAG: Ig-like domain-containing protein [Spirochaetia bacterium]
MKIPKIICVLLTLPALLVFLKCNISCSLLFGPSGGSPEVSACYPEKMLSSGEPLDITFSTAMDKSSVERLLTFAGPEGRVEGVFTWKNDKELRFLPEGVETPKRYILSIDKALNKEGIPMETPFRRFFSTLPDSSALQLLSCTPVSGAQNTAADSNIHLEFSAPVDRESFYDAFRVTPEVSGEYIWSGEDTEIEYIPDGDLSRDTEYTVRVSSECIDHRGIPLLEPFSSSFSTEDEDPQVLTKIEITSSESVHQADPEQLYRVEKDEALRLHFSQPLEKENREGLFDFSPDVPFSVEWSGGAEYVEISFPELLLWEEVYLLSVFEETYMFLCRGKNSQPIEVDEVFFCNHIDSSEPDFLLLEQNLILSPEDSVAAALDIRFSHAGEAELIRTSLLEAISLRTTNASAFTTLTSFELDPDSPQTPAASSPPEEGSYTTARLLFFLQTGGSSGRLLLELSDSAEDSLGNTLAEEFFMSLNL